ncbi:MAG: hypothetical protein HCAMLNBO_02708 [Candidatus Brocadia fulgida]|nr:hypothetical protein [Candidatus Brocadia fulgida]
MVISLICLSTVRYAHAQQEQKFPLSNAPGNLSISETRKSEGAQQHISSYAFEYAAPFLCGIQTDQGNTRLARGCYLTSITIRNPNDTEVKYSKNLVLTYPSGEQTMGKGMPLGEDVLKAGDARDITGEEIQQGLFPNGFPASYLKGLFVIRSMESLDVSALYETATISAENKIEALLGIEVKAIHERKIRQQNLPDLIIRDYDVSQLDVNCYDWSETCVTKVTFTIENTGTKDAGSFLVRVVFDPIQSVVVNLGVVGLDAGMSQVFTVKTPPGGNCFDPDCTVCVLIDSENRIAELDEDNNYRCINKLEK